MINFQTVPANAASVQKDYENQPALICAYRNAGDEDSAFMLFSEGIRYPMQKKISSGFFKGCVSAEDVQQDIYLTAVEKLRVYHPFFAGVLYRESKRCSLAEAVERHYITEDQANAIRAQVSVLNDTIGTPDCPYTDRLAFRDSLNAVVSSCPGVQIIEHTINPWAYMQSDITHAVAENLSRVTGISTNDRARAKRINEGKEVPKLDSTRKTLERILNSGAPSSYDALREQRAERGGEDSVDLHVSSIYTGRSQTASAEDRFIEEAENACADAIEAYKKAVRDNKLQKRVAQKVFWKTQVEQIIRGEIALSIQEIIEMTEKILDEYSDTPKA